VRIEQKLKGYMILMNEVFGLSIGLGAFSLSTSALAGIAEFMNAAFFFAVTYAFITLAWVSYSQFFDEYPMYDYMFLGLNFSFLFLIALVPFILRLMFYEAVALRQIAIQLFSFNMATIFIILAVMAQKHLLRSHTTISFNKKRHLKITRNSHSIVAFMFFLSLFVNKEATIAPLSNRSFYWLLIFIVPTVYTLAASFSFKSEQLLNDQSTSIAEGQGEILSNCCRRVTNAMLGVSIGLTAFSLIRLPLSSLWDMLLACIWFMNNFIIVFILLFFSSTCLAGEEPLDDLSIILSLVANFILALLALLLQGGILEIMGQANMEVLNLVPLCIAFALLCLGIMGLRFTSRFRGRLDIKEFDHRRTESLAMVFIAPLLLLFIIYKSQILEAFFNAISPFITLSPSSIGHLSMILGINTGWISLLGGMMIVNPVAQVIFRIQEGHWSSHKF
jgi:uncharacterized membrane protein